MEEIKTNLCERHFRDDGEHDFFSLCWVRVLLVLIEPGLERGRGLASGVLASGSQVVAASIPEEEEERCSQSVEHLF